MERLGRYEILGEIGHGAMGVVYRARDPQIDRIVALKALSLATISPDEEVEFRERFLREARAVGRLSHPGIVALYDAGEDETTHTPYIVMEYVEGRSLEVIGRNERLTVAAALDIVKQVAEALDAAHSRQIVHRDIKPANILVTGEGRAKITDFGIAKLERTQLTRSGQVFGTPTHMSPEQFTGEPLDGRSDLFSLGVILYWLLTGQEPFSGNTLATLSFHITYKDPIPASRVHSALRPEFDYVINRALAKRRDDRYARGNDLAADLDDLRHGRPPRSLGGAAPPTGAFDQTRSLPAPGATAPAPLSRTAALRRRLRPLYLGLAAVFLVLALVFWFYPRPPIEEQATPAPAAEPAPKPPPMSTLHLEGQHNFQEAMLSLALDGKGVSSVKLEGTAERRFLFLKRYQGTIAGSLRLPSGQHTLRVRVQAPADHYDQTRSITATLPPDGDLTLLISFADKTRDLELSWR